MKNLSLLLLTLWALSTNAQTNIYHQFPDSNAQWNIYTVNYGPYDQGTNYSIEISGDTIINDLTYHKLFTPIIIAWSQPKNSEISIGYNGAIREDTLLRKVYIVPKYGLTEELLYDFTMQVGDTITGFIQSLFEPKDVVLSIDSVLVGNSYRKKWIVNDSYNVSFIEGIGSTYGLIEKLPGGVIDYTYIGISCFRQNDQTLYPDTITTCDLITSVSKEIKSDKVIVYPNPTNGSFSIEFSQPSDIRKIEVADLSGKMIFLKENNFSSKLHIDDFPQGIFLLIITDLDGGRDVRKIVSE